MTGPSEETPPASLDGTAAPGSRDAAALVVVCGLPGVGKSTVAGRLADHVDGRVLRTDVIRKELVAEPEYTDAETDRVYDELLDRAETRLGTGESVVLDATFAYRGFREDAREVGDRAADRFDLVAVDCDEAVVERRIERRDGVSDADFEVHRHFKALFDPIEGEHVVVDNSGDEATTLERVDAMFAGSGPIEEGEPGTPDPATENVNTRLP